MTNLNILIDLTKSMIPFAIIHLTVKETVLSQNCVGRGAVAMVKNV